jgi:hypothetical protein
MSDNTVIVTPPVVVVVTVSAVGIQGPPGTGGADISSDLNNGLTTGSDGGLFVTNALDLGTFN